MDMNDKEVPKILPQHTALLEDESLTAVGAQISLEKLGCRVLYTENDPDRMRERLATEPPEVALIDLRVQVGFDGLKTVRAAGSDPNINVLVMTGVSDPEILALARRWGADGVINKLLSLGELYEALEHLAQGSEYIGCTINKRIAEGWWFVERLDWFDELEPADRHMVQLVGQGYTSADIAKKLKVKIKTVSNRRNLISNRLELKEYGGLERFAQLVAAVPVEEIG